MYLCQIEFVPINYVKSVYLQETNVFATGYDYFSFPHFLTLTCFWAHKWEIPKEVDCFFRSDMGYAGFTFGCFVISDICFLCSESRPVANCSGDFGISFQLQHLLLSDPFSTGLFLRRSEGFC